MEKSSTCNSVFGRRRGFTLLEMSIVIAIIGMILGGGAVIFAASLKQRQFNDTVARIEKIQEMLLAYRIAFDRLPAPWRIQFAPGHGEMCGNGIVEVDEDCDDGNINNYDTCSNGCTSSNPPWPPLGSFISGEIIAGMVPVLDLGLSDEYIVDGWGRRLLYVVDRRLVYTDAFDSIPVSDTTTRITVRDATGGTKTTQAAYVVLSFGDNGHGAYPRNGGSSRFKGESVNTNELENCDCTSAAVNGTFDTIFVQAPPSENPSDINDSFDDILMYGTRASLRSNAE